MAERKRRSGCVFAIVALLLVGIGGVILLGLVGIVAGGGAAWFLMARQSNDMEALSIEASDDVVSGTEAEVIAEDDIDTDAASDAGDADTDAHVEAPEAADPASAGVGPASAPPAASGTSSSTAPGGSSAATGSPSGSAASGGSDPSTPSASTRPSSSPSSSGRGVPEEAAPSSASAGSVSIAIEGDAKVSLLRSGRKFAMPGSVPAGRYDVEAAFPGQDPLVVTKITVRDGTPMTITCNSRMGICRAR